MRKMGLLFFLTLGLLEVRADIKVSDVEIFSGYPWTGVMVGYTITGTDDKADAIKLTMIDRSQNNAPGTAKILTGAKLSEGRHVMRWDCASQGSKSTSTNIVFNVSVVELDGVQLWADGPYWAECNAGATKREEYGYYFMWGDTTANYDFNGYVWRSRRYGVYMDSDINSRKCPTSEMHDAQLQSAGYIDVEGNLVTMYDAASLVLGTPWRMPTREEFAALLNKCTTTYGTCNGVNGLWVQGKGDYISKYIFLPAAGCVRGTDYWSAGIGGHYWSSTMIPGTNKSSGLFFGQSDVFLNSESRYLGCSVRPVRDVAK